MPRYKLIVEFDGSPFVGWQRQENGSSVQAAIEAAALAFCGAETTAHAAGRTDAGVHALAMPVHIDLPGDYRADTVRDALNHCLKPAPIAVLSAQAVGDEFHARFKATARHYLYRIDVRRAPLALDAGRVWRVHGRLDIDRMNAACAYLIGKHDFTTFRSVRCQAPSPQKSLTNLRVERDGDRVTLFASAPSFLRHQVRSMVGTLAQVGLGRWRPIDVKTALEARDRSACGPVAPPYGLYFVSADYEKA